jgi:hypothetical protein
MSALGIYFGPKVISIVQSEGKKLLAYVDIPLAAALDSNPVEAKIPEHVKLATLLKDEMRRCSIDTRVAEIVLPGKDMIIRTFHMPILSSDEIPNAVRFEAKKYIPFKVEDLISDYQIKVDKSTRKNFVLFMGMKKDVLDKYLAVLGQLDMRLNSIEYSGFGILRLLKLAKVKEKGISALINIDLVQDDEVNFVVLENGFPLFSRDITLVGEAAYDHLRPAQPDIAANLEKVKIELRISLDFYLRKFPTKNIQSVIFITPDEFRGELESFIKERGLSAKFIDSKKLFEKPVSFSSGFLKAYAGSIGRTVKGPFACDLLPGKMKKRGAGVTIFGVALYPILSRIKVDFRALLLGACIIGLPYLVDYYQKQPLEQHLLSSKNSRPAVTAVNAESDLSVLQASDAGYRQKINIVKNLLRSRLLLTPALDALPRVMGKGLWLSSLTLQSDGKGTVLTLSGCVYLGDGNREMDAVNGFISDLKNLPEFSKSFGNISLVSVDQGQLDNVLLTNFKIACRSQ